MNNLFFEELGFQCKTLLEKAYHDDIVSKSLLEGSLGAALLVEAFNKADADNLKETAKKIKQVIEDLENTFAPLGDEWKNVFTRLKNAIPEDQAKRVAEMIISGDEKSIKKSLPKLSQQLYSISAEASALVSVVNYMKEVLQDFNDIVEDAGKGEEPIASMEGLEGFPSLDKLAKGMKKAYDIPTKLKSAWQTSTKDSKQKTGFFKKIGSFLSGIVKGWKAGTVVDFNQLADAFKSTPFKALMEIDLKSNADDISNFSQEASDISGTLNAGGGSSSSGTGSSSSESSGSGGSEGAGGSKDAGGPKDAGGSEDAGGPGGSEGAGGSKDAGGSEGSGGSKDAGGSEGASSSKLVDRILDKWSAGLGDEPKARLKGDKDIDVVKGDIKSDFSEISDRAGESIADAINDWAAAKKDELGLTDDDISKLSASSEEIADLIRAKLDESPRRLSRRQIASFTHRYLDKKYAKLSVLSEVKRWQRLAGLKG
jgi:uncharacterized membrane protein YgcG